MVERRDSAEIEDELLARFEIVEEEERPPRSISLRSFFSLRRSTRESDDGSGNDDDDDVDVGAFIV